MKVIATDYDGTLSYNGIDEQKREAIALWRKNGNLFGVVSGRGLQSIKKRLLEDKIEVDFLIANNGAAVCDGKGNLLNEKLCTCKGIKELLEFVFYSGCMHARIDTNNGSFTVKRKEEQGEGEYTTDTLPLIKSFTQISVLFETHEDSKRVSKSLSESFLNLYNPIGSRRWIDIVANGVCKSKALHKLKEIYGINKEDIITVGDSENDIDMLKNFKSFAMENALDEVKKVSGGTVKDITEIISQYM